MSIPWTSGGKLDRLQASLDNRLDQVDKRLFAFCSQVTDLEAVLADALRKQPLQVSLTEDQVSQVMARFNDPLIIPREISGHIAEAAKHGNMNSMHNIGYGPAPLGIETQMRPDGTLQVVLTDCNRQPFWQGVFHAVTGS